MAKLKHPFNGEQVRGFKGVLDFYYWHGIPVVRKWPRPSNLNPTPAQHAQRAAFTHANDWISQTTEPMKVGWRATVAAPQMTWTDYVRPVQIKCYQRQAVMPPYLIHHLAMFYVEPEDATYIRYSTDPAGDIPVPEYETVAFIMPTPATKILWQFRGYRQERGRSLSKLYEPNFPAPMYGQFTDFPPFAVGFPGKIDNICYSIQHPGNRDAVLPLAPFVYASIPP